MTLLKSSRSPRTATVACLLLMLLAATVRAAAPLAAQAQQRVAVRAETLYPMDGRAAPIQDGIVLVEGGEIVAVGPASQVDVPDGYRLMETVVATPGLVDARATVGITSLTNRSDGNDELDRTEAIQPELRALDAYSTDEPLVAFVRGLGVTTVHAGHAPGALMSGQTMIAKTAGRLEEALVDTTAMVTMTLGPQVSDNYDTPGTRAKGVAMLRAAFLDAERYREEREGATSGEGPSRNLRMEILMKVLDGEVPALVTAHRAGEIQSAMRLADEFGFRLVLSGGAESYLLADELAAAGVPVVLHPTTARTGGEAENAAFTTARALMDAGVRVAIQSGYEAYVPKTHVVLHEAAVAAGPGGLSRHEALRAVTIDAARILGVAGRVGSLEEGKDADLALFDGDPLEYTTHVCSVLIEGEVVSDDCN